MVHVQSSTCSIMQVYLALPPLLGNNQLAQRGQFSHHQQHGAAAGLQPSQSDPALMSPTPCNLNTMPGAMLVSHSRSHRERRSITHLHSRTTLWSSHHLFLWSHNSSTHFPHTRQTVDVEKALGKPHSLWCAFAKFYERHGDVPNARVIFEKAVQVRGQITFCFSAQAGKLAHNAALRAV